MTQRRLALMLICACGGTAAQNQQTGAPEPVPVPPSEVETREAPPRYTGLAAASDGACVLDRGVPVCWGELFDFPGSPTPVRIDELGEVDRVVLGGLTTCVMAGTHLRCFGAYNEEARGARIEQAYDEADANGEEPPEDLEARLYPAMVSSEARGATTYDTGGCYLDGQVVRCWDEAEPESDGFAEFAIGGTADIVQLDGSATHRCILQADGRVRCWGEGTGLGWISEGGEEEPDTPGLTAAHGIEEIAVGDEFTCARREDGSVVCWGAILYSLGLEEEAEDGTPTYYDIPRVSAHRIFAGGSHACAIGNENRVWCWGENERGQLGDGTLEARSEPVEATVLGRVHDLALGYDFMCGANTEGVRCVGSNRWSTMGVQPEHGPTPFPSQGTRVFTSGYRTCVESASGDLMCTGRDRSHSLQARSRVRPFETDAQVVQMSGYVSTQCVLDRNHHLECTSWNGVRHQRDGVAEVRVGTWSTCARLRDRRVQCWRHRANRGGDDLLNRHVDPTMIPGLDRIESFDVGEKHACAVRSDGRVLCWGDNTRKHINQAGGTLTTPVEIEGVRDAVQVDISGVSTCVRKRDKTVTCWSTSRGPEPLAGVDDVVDMVSTARRYFLRANHEVWMQRGMSPVTRVDGLEDIVEVSAGTTHVCARARDGRVWCWGVGDHGELGVVPAWVHTSAVSVTLPN